MPDEATGDELEPTVDAEQPWKREKESSSDDQERAEQERVPSGERRRQNPSTASHRDTASARHATPDGIRHSLAHGAIVRSRIGHANRPLD
jgi:hypothetical protein